MTFPPPPPPPPDPPAPGQWQPNPQQPAPQQPYGQQPATQQPYGQLPYAPPVPAASEPGRGWVVPAVVIGSLVTIGAVFAASATREGTDSADTAAQARDAVVRLTTAMTDGDCAGVEAASTGGYFRALAMTCEDIAAQAEYMSEAGMTFVVGEAEMERDSADVPVEIVVTGDLTEGGSGIFTVVRTGDTWRVSNDQAG